MTPLLGRGAEFSEGNAAVYPLEPQEWRRLPVFLALCGLLIVVAAVWIPFGLSKTGLIEDWSFYALLDQGISLHDAMNIESNRPFVFLGWAIGYWLTPDSYVGLNILHVMLMILKGVLLFSIVSELSGRAYALAFWTAALFMIDPADRDVFATHVTNYHVAVVFYLAASYFLLLYWRTNRRALLVLAMVALVFDLGTIEVSYPLVLITPGLLLLADRRLTKRFWRVVAVWYSVPCILVLLAAANSMRAGSYQTHVLQMERLGIEARVTSALFHLGRAYYRTLIGVWVEIVRSGSASPLYVGIGIGVALGVTCIGIVLLRWTRSFEKNDRVAATAGVIGLIVVGAGFAMFLPLPHRAFNEHVFLFSSAGASLTLAAVGWWLCTKHGISRVVGICFFGAMTTAAVIGALNLHATAAAASLEEQGVLASLARQMPVPPRRPAVVLVFDPDDELSISIWNIGSSVEFIHTVRYFYGDPDLQVYLCYPEKGIWGLLNEGCQFNPMGVEITWSGRLQGTYRYDQIVAFQYDPADGVLQRLAQLPASVRGMSEPNKYNPTALVNEAAPPPRRVHTLLSSWPFERHLLHQYATARASYDFNYRVPGVGWWQPSRGVAWSNSVASNIDVLLKEHHDYIVEFRIEAALSPTYWKELVLKANGFPVFLSWAPDGSGGRQYTGRIHASAIDRRNGLTRLSFQLSRIFTPQELGMNTDTRHMGFAFDWVRIFQAPYDVPAPILQDSRPATTKVHGGGHIRIDFDSAVPGSGWSRPSDSHAWMTTEESDVSLPLRRGAPYRIHFRVLGALDPDVLDQLSLEVARQRIKLTRWIDDNGAVIYEGYVPDELISGPSKDTRLVFRVASATTHDPGGRGVMFDWIEASTSSTPPSD